ncbi:S1/P1 nuclease [Pisolithus marmoratus]|nr:S1/P1 nuclease [Pisolithus marmoratus]
MQLSTLFVFTVAALIPQALSWGVVGHEIIATVAQMHLHPSVLPKLCAILEDDASDYDGSCHLATVAAWADRARQEPKYRWTGPLHYIGAVDDYPSNSCAFPGSSGWAGRTHINVLSGIRNVTTVLQDYEGHVATENVDGYVQDALKFLIHFLGDMHQPLHLTGRDRGGNDNKVSFDGRVTNLHSLWDTLLIAQRLRTLHRNYTRPLPLPDVENNLRATIYDPYIRRLVWEGLLGKYEHEISSWLTCPIPERLRILPLPRWQRALLWLFGSKSEDGGLGVDDELLCPYHWAQSIHSLNCEIVWPAELDQPLHHRIVYGEDDRHGHFSEETSFVDMDDFESSARRKNSYLELDTPQYAGRIRDEWIVEKLLAQGGIRLAAVLNWLFTEPTGAGSGHLSICNL